MAGDLHAVTGALGYTGRSLTEQLLALGHRVRTLTNSPRRPNPFGEALQVRPLAFDDREALARSLEGCRVLYNTYWVRFNHRLFTFEGAVRNTLALFDAARRAGVERIVHVSILHAEEADDLGYYKGKHELEDALRASGMAHAIVRPGVLFGRGDILINNIAWALRRLPVFGIFGDGTYALRPLHVDDMARLMIAQVHREGNTRVDAAGPERHTYRGLVEMLAGALGVRRALVRVSPSVGLLAASALGPIVGDVVLTRQEIAGLMRGLLDSPAPEDVAGAGAVRLSNWAREHRETLGRRYASEVGRRIRREVAYEHA